MPLLTVRNLRVTYRGSIVGLRNVSLDVPEGGVVAVLGSNGAGKTTLLRAISGVIGEHGGAVESGSIESHGVSLVRRAPASIVGLGVVQSPEGRRIFEHLTVAENLRIGGYLIKNKAEKARSLAFCYDLFPVLAAKKDLRAGLFSGGQQQMLAIGRALMASPKLLLLDEPSLGLDPRNVGVIGRAIGQINAQGTTVMVVEQNAAMALGVASHAFVLTNGEVSLSGTAQELASDERVRNLYLGQEAEAAVDQELAATAGTRPRLSRWNP